MQLLSNKNLISSLELVEQINLFRKEDGKSDLGHNDLLKIIRDGNFVGIYFPVRLQK